MDNFDTKKLRETARLDLRVSLHRIGMIPTVNNVKRIVDLLPEQDRVELFHKFCIHCGTDDPRCQCWNDE